MRKKFRTTIKKYAAFLMAASLFITGIDSSLLVVGATEPGTTQDGAATDGTTEEQEEEKDYNTEEWPEQGVMGNEVPKLKALEDKDFTSNYDAGSDAEAHLYTITIATGIKSGNGVVQYIAVKYKTVKGLNQTKYILMTDDPLIDSYDYMSKKAPENKELTDRHKKLESLNYYINEPSQPKALEPWSVNEYLFKTEEDIAEITGVDVLMETGSWTVQGIVISKVTKIAGYGECGFYSGNYFFGLGKQRICELEKKKKGTLTISANGDALLHLASNDSAYFGLKQLKEDKQDAIPFRDLYTFRIDFGDTLEGGLESYLKNSARDGDIVPDGFVEDLALEVEYKDKNGWNRIVTMPVMMSAFGQYLTSKDKVNSMGLAQRGETVAFTGILPEYDKLVSTTLYSGSNARSKLESTGGFRLRKQSGLQSSLDGDNYSVTGISVYKGTCRLSNTDEGTDIVTGEKLKSYTTTYSFAQSDPLYYYTTDVDGGRSLSASSKEKITMRTYKKGSPLVSQSFRDTNLLIRLLTDDTSTRSGTRGNVTVRLHYLNNNDKEVTSMPISMKSGANDYLGRWPSNAGIVSDFAYSYGMKPGNYVEVATRLDDLVMLLDVEVSVEEAAGDEYQLSGISIATVEDIGRRRIYKQECQGEGDISGYRIVRSNTHAEISPFPIKFKSPKLIVPGETQSFNVGGSGAAGGYSSNSGADYNGMRYSMTYEQTKLNLGFAKALKSYDVNVKVADDSENANDNGDSGSVNNFYFQLQFRNGNSGYVLANQQLSSDGFRAGYQELFTVSVNRDYGELKSVRVIPEDIEEESDIFDKLNIERITVTEKTNGGAAVEYVLEDVGWVGIDYHDSAEAAAISGRKGRSASQISSRFSVSYQRNVVGLLCEMTTLPWTGLDIGESSGDEVEPTTSISCDLEYVDTFDQPQTISFDIVRRMAEYMKMTPKNFEASADGSDKSYFQNMGTISDPKWMLRPNHTDRFILPGIPNLKSVKKMTVYAVNRNSKGTTYWVIGGVSISEVLEDGALSLTSDDEYYRNLVTNPLCRNLSSREKEVMTLPTGVSQPLTFKFSDNELVYNESNTWVTPVTRLPESEDDTINAFIYPSETSRDVDGIKVKMAAQYSMAFSQMRQVSANLSTYGSGTEDAMFYITGLSAPGMEGLKTLGLSCVNSRMLFNHAIIQHVKEGVVVSNYYVPLNNGSAIIGLKGIPMNMSDEQLDKPARQEVHLALGTDTVESSLVAEDNDIAVAIKYRSTLDNGQSEYYSPYKYLTDIDYKKITPGMMIDVPFTLPFVSEITGYRIGAFGNINASVEGAIIADYSYDSVQTDVQTGEVSYTGLTRDGVYSFSTSRELGNAISELGNAKPGMKGDETVNLLDLTFKTADASADGESGTDTPVQMTFNYVDHFGQTRSRVIPDVRPYIQADKKKFETGKEARIEILLGECSDLISIDVRPYSQAEGERASWTVESISGSLELGDRQINRTINQTFTDIEGGTINIKEARLSTSVVDNMGKTYRVTDHNFSMMAKEGDKITVQPRIDVGGGYTAQAFWVVNGVETDVTSTVLMRQNNDVVFTAPTNTSQTAETYKVVITSAINPATFDTIYITIPASETVVQETTSSSDAQSSSQSSQEGDSGNNTSSSESSQSSDDTSSDQGGESGSSSQ